MSQFPHLFSPITIRGLILKNRVVMPGMGTKFMSDGQVTDQVIDYHLARTRGGCGLNMVEVSCVHSPSAPPTYGNLSEDRFVPGYRRLVQAVHRAGGKVGVMLWQGSIAVASHPGVQVIVASDLPAGPDLVWKGADRALLEELTACYAQAARRAIDAGMDCLELHAAHNYIIHSFLSGGINRRTDEYGGSLENRARFPLAVVRAIRAQMPREMPLFMRIDAHDDYLEGGLTIQEVIQFCKWAGEAGVDVLDVSRGNIISNALKYEVPPIDIPYMFNADNAARIKEETGMTVMAVGRINGAQMAEKLVAGGKADLIGMGRVQLTDPDFCNKAAGGRVAEIKRCIGCNQGCFDAHMNPEMLHITCLRNPAVGREREYALVPAGTSRTVLVAGGGMAGMEAADLLQQRGHRAILCEESEVLGGRFLLAGLAPRKAEMRAAAQHRGRMLQHAGVELRLNTRVTPRLLEELRPDAVVNAVGARPVRPGIPGAGLPHVLDADAVLQGAALPHGEVVVVGGGMVGLETAEFLAATGRSVTVVEMAGEMGAGLGATRKICVMEEIARRDIRLLSGTTCLEVTADAVVVEQDGARRALPAPAVVFATGARSNSFEDCEGFCRKRGIPVHTVGDALRPRRALEAVAEAAAVARII